MGCLDVFTFNTGTLMVKMWDNLNAYRDEEVIPVLWSGNMNGLLIDVSNGAEARLIRFIDQAFGQSPYLKVD